MMLPNVFPVHLLFIQPILLSAYVRWHAVFGSTKERGQTDSLKNLGGKVLDLQGKEQEDRYLSVLSQGKENVN